MLKIQKVDTKQTAHMQQSVHHAPHDTRAPISTDHEDQLLAHHDTKDRAAYVERIKALVDAGTYRVEGVSVAQALLAKPFLRDILGVGRHNLLTPEEER